MRNMVCQLCISLVLLSVHVHVSCRGTGENSGKDESCAYCPGLQKAGVLPR